MRQSKKPIYRSKRRPSAEGYASVISQTDISDAGLAMLSAHCRTTDMTMTACELAAADYSRWAPACQFYGDLGRKIAEELAVQPAYYSNGLVWTSTLAEITGASNGRWTWKLYPEVAAAIASLNIAS